MIILTLINHTSKMGNNGHINSTNDIDADSSNRDDNNSSDDDANKIVVYC